jgi:prevent-host-death family protein
MKQVAYTNARATMVDLMEETNDTHEPVEITRRGKRSVVMMGYEDYMAIKMTMEMMDNPEALKDMLLSSVQNTLKTAAE